MAGSRMISILIGQHSASGAVVASGISSILKLEWL